MDITTAVQFPKVAIRFCVQCKWNLRAAYYAQELLQTFSNTIGEISLIPVTGGVFTIHLFTLSQSAPNVDAATTPASEIQHSASNGTNTTTQQPSTVTEHLIWDRKRDSGFPETKELKGRVRALIDPEKDMGHIDRALKKGQQNSAVNQSETQSTPETLPGLNQTIPPADPGNIDSKGVIGTEIVGTAKSSTGHEKHQVSINAISDCAECMAAVKEDGIKAENAKALEQRH